MELLDSWYAVALASALPADRPLPVTLFSRPYALWRGGAGEVYAVHDRCPHKGASLSAGRVAEGQLRCGYHGWCFGSDGRCQRIPANGSDQSIPQRARAVAVPAREAHGFLWLWNGADPDAQPGPFPAIEHVPTADDRAWRNLEGSTAWRAHWLRVLEAFMDLTHAPFVHSGSFGAMAADRLMPDEQRVGEDELYERVLAPRDRHYRAEQGRGLGSLFQLKSAPASDAEKISNSSGVQHIHLWLANVSLVRVEFGDFRITLFTAHVPETAERTVNLWRHFRSFLRSPLADGNARQRVDTFMAEDQRQVETLTPAIPDLDGHGDLLLASDAMTLALRRVLRARRSAGLLRAL